MRYLLLLALLSCSSVPKQNKYVFSDKVSPIVRLSAIMGDGQKHFFCSGTVISNIHIVTAAHCVADAPYGTVIIVSSILGREISTATIHSFGYQLDIAVLDGDFKAFGKMPIETDTVRLQHAFEDSSELQACGYPSGAGIACKSFSHAHPYEFMYSAPGVSMYPGMSGGPVIDMETGRLIGVNSAMTDHEALLSPVVELYTTLNVPQD